MGTSVYTSLLIKDYKRKNGEIKSLRKELRELAKVVLEKEREVSAIATIIQAREPGMNLSDIKSIATRPKILGMKWNKLTISILNCLREANGAIVPSNVIADYVIEKGDVELENRAVLTVVRRSVKHRLKTMAREGRVIRHHNAKTQEFGLWSLPGNE